MRRYRIEARVSLIAAVMIVVMAVYVIGFLHLIV